MLELASLKFSVDTSRLEATAKLLDTVAQKAGELGKATRALTEDEKKQTKAAIESAKAADLQAATELKLAKIREKDAQVVERNARAAKTAAESSIRQAESAAKLEAIQLRKIKGNNSEIESLDKLTKSLADYKSKVEFVEQGNTRVEASILTMAKNLGATSEQMKTFGDLFDRMRKMQKGDAFDGSTGALRKLKLELEVSQQLLKNFGTSGALTRSQMTELGRALHQVEAEGKQFNLTQAQIAAQQDIVRKEFIATAQAANSIDAQLKQLRQSTTQTADAHVKAYEKEQAARHRAIVSFNDYLEKVGQTKLATKELYSQGVFSRTTINQFVELERRAKEAGISLEQLNQIKSEFGKMDAGNAGLKFQHDLIKGLTTQVLALGAAYMSIQGVVQAGAFFIKTADDMKLLKSRLDIAGEGTINFKRDFGNLVKIANDARSPIEAVTTVFTRLVPIMPAMGKGVKEATQVTEALTKMLRISGRGAQEASSAMLQFSQAMAKGKLDGDEFRSIAENLPEVLRVLEKQTGKTRAEIMLMSSAGMLTSTMMTEAMIKSLDKLNEQLKKMPETVEGATTVLKNNFTLLVTKMDEASGVSDKLAKSILDVASGVKNLADSGPGVSAIMAGISAFASASVLTGLAGLAARLIAIAAGYSGVMAAVSGFAGFLVSNPIGLALVGIGLATGVSAFIEAQRTQVRSLSEGNDKLKKLKDERTQILADMSKEMTRVEVLGSVGGGEVQTRIAPGMGRIKAMLDQNTKDQELVSKTLVQFSKTQAQTAEEQFRKTLTPAQMQAKSPEQMLADSGFDTHSKKGLSADYLKQSQELYDGLDKQIKTHNFNYEQSVKSIKDLGLPPQEQDARLKQALEDRKKAVQRTSDATLNMVTELKRKYQEGVDSIDKKEKGPTKQATSEGYGVQNDAILENLKKRYDAEMKTIREGETSKQQLLASSGAVGAELFQKQYQIADEANKAESARANQYYNEVNAQTEDLIKKANENYARFVKEQSGKEGFSEANKKMIESRDNYIKKLNEGLKTTGIQITELNNRNSIDLFTRLGKDINEAGKEIIKLNKEITNLINKEVELKAERDASEQAQIDSIGLTEKQIAMLKAETDERNRLSKEKQKVFADVEIAKANLQNMIAKQKELAGSALTYTREEDALNSAIEDQQVKLAALNITMDQYNGLLATLPQEQAARALRELNRNEVKEFSNKIADALMQGLSGGAKTGSRAIRKIIMDELKKPITITVQALVSGLVGNLTGGGSNGVLGSLTSMLGLGNNPLASVANFFGMGSGGIAGVASGAAAGSDAALAALGYAGPSALGAGAASTGIMASLGSVASMLGPIAAAVGVAKLVQGDFKLAGLGDLSILLPGMSRLFGMGSKKTTATGISGTFDSGGFSGNTFQDWKQKGGLFRDDKKGTKLGALDSETDNSLDKAFSALKLSAIESAKAMNLTVDSIVNFSKTVRVEFGQNADENNAKMQEMLNGMSDDIARILIPSIDSIAAAGERAKDTFARLALNLTSINSMVGNLGLKLIDVSVVGAVASSALADMFGGLDKLKEATSTYYDSFYSDAEKMTLSAKLMQDSLTAVDKGLTLPKTKEEFRKMVDVLDLNTEYGRNLYAVLVKIAPTFDTFTTAIETVKTKVKEAASTLRESIFTATYGTKLPEQQLSSLKESFDSLIASAALQSGDELAGTSEKISSSLQPLLDKVKEVYASGPEYFKLQEEILSKAGMIANRSDNLGTYEDRSLASLTDISSILAKINESGQLTVVNLEKLIGYGNVTNPVDTSTPVNPSQVLIVKANNEASSILAKLNAKSLADGLTSQIAESLSKIDAFKESGVQGGTSNSLYNAVTYKTRFAKYLADLAALTGVLDSLQNQQNYQNSIAGDIGSQDTEAKLNALRKQITDAGGVPAFAKGAAFSGGVVKEPTLFNMGLMGEAGAEGILPLTRTSSGSLGVQSVGVGSQEVSERLVESNRHLGALVRLQQASNLKIIEKLSEVEQRLEGIETAARLEATA
jgi:tape measure domain-containing protein